MPSPSESRAELAIVTANAEEEVGGLLSRFSGSPEVRRAALLESVPAVISYYADGTAVLASDFYEEQRALAAVRTLYTPELVLVDRTVKIRRAIAWACEPLFGNEPDDAGTLKRLAGVVQIESARPYRDTITSNSRLDPEAIGWKRVTNNCCPFCSMLAAKGAVYRASSARFAAHEHCDCSAAPVFKNGDAGPEASALQYRASKRNRTPAQRAELREYLAAFH